MKTDADNGIRSLAERLLHSVRAKQTGAFFITGTDTGVGKTHVVCALLDEFRRQGIRAAGFKPICCGIRTDAHRLRRCSGCEIPLAIINPIHLSRPLAPVSQRCPPWTILLRRIRFAFSQLAARNLRMILVEGAGGLLCPVDSARTMRDLARALRLPLVIVAPNELGALNQSLLTLEAAAAGNLACHALVLNQRCARYDASRLTNKTVLSRWTRVPVCAIPFRSS